MEPRHGSSRGQEASAPGRTERKADGWQAPEGSRPGCGMASAQATTGVCERGMSSEGERGNVGAPPVSLCQPRKGGPGEQKPWRALGLPPGLRALRGHPERTEAHQVSERRATSAALRDGEVAVGAAQSTDESGEVRPKRPTGGKAPSGRASAGRRQGRDCERTNPDHGTPGDCIRAAAALPEEPYACIAPVRVCGGAGWVTTGSTRHVGRRMEVNKMPGHVGREAVPHRRQQPVKDRGRW